MQGEDKDGAQHAFYIAVNMIFNGIYIEKIVRFCRDKNLHNLPDKAMLKLLKKNL